MTAVTAEAVAAAQEAIRQHTGHRVTQDLAAAALTAAAPHIVAASRGEALTDWELIRGDIDALLKVLGLAGGLASPHEDMRAAISEAGRLRALARPPAGAGELAAAAGVLMDAFPLGQAAAAAVAEVILQIGAGVPA